LYEFRGALDSLAARLAARKQVKIDKSLVATGRKVSKGNDIRAMIEVDMAFHTAIYAASGNPLIAESARLHWMHLRRVMGAVHQVIGQRKSVWDEHAAIAEAIAQGDEELAAKLSLQHTEFARQNLVENMSRALPDASTLERRAR
jgi:DNA-binding GntR family transcriptional regulator